MSQPTTVLKDYNHAARVFGTKTKTIAGIGSDFKNYRLSPKYGFLFYVEFDFNPMVTNVSNISAQEMGMIVKSVNLPKFTIDTKIHNAYNRKNIVQNKISYDPVNIVFHDDQADTVRNFWYDYYSFFYRDSDYSDSTYGIISKYQERPSFEWGYTPRPNGGYNSANAYQNYQYIQAIRIYSLYQQNFSEYELINPTITNFKHGEHVNGENTSILEHQMSVVFETVKYQTGYVTDNTVGGMITLNYDTTNSPNYYPNGNSPGASTNTDVITDLANNNLLTAGGSVVQSPNPIALNSALNFASSLGSGILTSATAGTNSGGFSLPSLGSVTKGISSSNILQQQLIAAATSLAGSSAATLAGGVIKGVTNALGPTGTSIVGIAAAAIANPSAALTTVENMAIKFAVSAATSLINSYAQQLGSQATTSISKFLAPYVADISQGISYAAANAKLITDPGGLVTPVTDSVTGAVTYTFTPSSVINSASNFINADATQLAGQGLSASQISATLVSNYGTDPAVADLIAYNAVGASGVSQNSIQNILPISISNGDSGVVVGNPIVDPSFTTTVIPPDDISAPPDISSFNSTIP